MTSDRGPFPLKIRRIEPPAGWGEIDWEELRNSGDLLYLLVWRNLALRYKQTYLGVGWVVLQPLTTMIIFTVVFGRLGKMPSDGLPHPVFYCAGLLPWTYFANALTSATNSITDHSRVITRVYFPRILLPAASILSALVDLGIAFVAVLALTLAYGIAPTAALLTAPLFAAMAALAAFGIGLWFAGLNATYRDLRYVLQFLIMLGLFVSPVTYPASLVPGEWQWLYGFNPMAGAIEGFRWAITGGTAPPSAILFSSVVSTGLILFGGVLYFQRLEPTLADVV